MSERPALGTIFTLLQPSTPITIVDIGASAIDGTPPYQPLLAAKQARLIGFEPDINALHTLLQSSGPQETYLPYAIGDGERHTLRLCRAAGMSSLLEPDTDVLGMFHFFTEWAAVERTEEIDTVRLDDIAETRGLDMLKIDVQGAEMMVFEHAAERLDNALVVHTEVEFLPMYKGQPLFADIAAKLQQHGLYLYTLTSCKYRTLRPVNPYAGLNQLLWSDAIFIRDIMHPQRMQPEQLLKQACILHECYAAYDIALHLLTAYDRATGNTIAPIYHQHVQGAEGLLAFRQHPEKHRH